MITGGLAQDEGLLAALGDSLNSGKKNAPPLDVIGHPLSIFAGAIGAAIWGAFRKQRLELAGAAWTSNTATSSAAP